jgi:hypothetical protein
MRELAWLGLVALLASAGSYYSSSRFGFFGWANLIGGATALAAAFVLWLRRARGLDSPAARRLLLPRVAGVVAALAIAYGITVGADRANLVWDVTADDRYTLAPATREALARLPGPLTATLYVDPADNRARSTRLLLETLATDGAGRVTVRERSLEESPEDVARHQIDASNTVVLALGERAETVVRPTEGALFEGLRRLTADHGQVIYVARGEGEGDLQREGDAGFTGLAEALKTEGFTVRDLVMAALSEVPADAALVMLVAPQRPLRAEAIAALEAWLERGGRLVALLEPGVETGVEALLARFGFDLPDEVIVDPASGPVEGDAPGVNPIVFQYATHPATRGLDGTRMVFFRRARPVLAARKPQPDDELRAVAFASRRSWLAPNAAAVQRGAAPEEPADRREDYWPVLALGAFPRPGGEARIAVFGDADFASNRYLRSLYNLDLLMNTIHWVAQRESEITLRPKSLTPDQYPLTPQQSLEMLYGVGLLIPELLVAAAAWTWVRRRSA